MHGSIIISSQYQQQLQYNKIYQIALARNLYDVSPYTSVCQYRLRSAPVLCLVLSCLVCSVFNIANLCLCNDDHHNRSVVYVCLDIFESLIFQLPCAHHVLETSCLGGFVYHMCCQFELLMWRLM